MHPQASSSLTSKSKNPLKVDQSKQNQIIQRHTIHSTHLQVKTIKMLTNHNYGSGMSNAGVAGAIDPSPPISLKPEMLQPNQGAGCSRGPPCFLMKTYAMVDDPNTNHIISWSLSGTSLVISDHIKLAQEIFPNYFKHNNFSSFIYQLNNYGFRKIGLEEWEYENQWFQRGNKKLLLNINRRDKTSRVIKRRCSKKRCIDVANDEIDNTQLENLRNHIAAYKEEIQKLKEHQALLQDNIALLRKHVGVTQDNSLKIIKFLGRAFGGITLKDVTQEVTQDTVCKDNDEVCKENDAVAENRLTSDTDQVMELNVAIPEEKVSRSCQESTFWRKFLEVDMQDDNQSEPDFVRNQFMLNMDLDDMMEFDIGFIAENERKPPKIDAGEVSLCLWN